MIHVLLLSFAAWMVAVIAYVYAVPLTEPKMILHKWYKFLDRLLMPRYEWLFKPLVDCEKCVAGQLSLWLYFFPSLNSGSFLWQFHVKQFTYYPTEHIYFVSLSILFTLLIKKILR